MLGDTTRQVGVYVCAYVWSENETELNYCLSFSAEVASCQLPFFPHLLHTLLPPSPKMYTVRRRQQVN